MNEDTESRKKKFLLDTIMSVSNIDDSRNSGEGALRTNTVTSVETSNTSATFTSNNTAPNVPNTKSVGDLSVMTEDRKR